MLSIPKILVVLIVLGIALWGWHKLSKLRRADASRPRRAQGRAMTQDLVKCPRCGVFAAAGAGCGREDCPRG